MSNNTQATTEEQDIIKILMEHPGPLRQTQPLNDHQGLALRTILITCLNQNINQFLQSLAMFLINNNAVPVDAPYYLNAVILPALEKTGWYPKDYTGEQYISIISDAEEIADLLLKSKGHALVSSPDKNNRTFTWEPVGSTFAIHFALREMKLVETTKEKTT